MPPSMRREIFDTLHANKLGGHMGINSLISKVRQRVYWPGYKEDIVRWTQFCDPCQKRQDIGRGRAPLQQLAVGMPMERMALDILGPLPETIRGNRFVVVIMDYFTKWAEAFALVNHKAATVADCLVTEVFLRLGVPHQLHSDKGSDFESKLFTEMCKLMGTNKTRTTAYRPQSDGLVERFNRSLQMMISKLTNEFRDNWDQILPFVLCAYRATAQQSTKFTPNFLMLGREALLPIDLVYGYSAPDTRECHIDYTEWVRQAMETAFERCRKELATAAMRQAKHYNRLSGDPTYQVGTWVLLFYPPLANKKLALKFLGPYKVCRKIGEVTYEIEAPRTGKKKIAHVNHLKPYWYEIRPEDEPLFPDMPETTDLENQEQADRPENPFEPVFREEEAAQNAPGATGDTGSLNPDALPFIPGRSRRPPARFGEWTE